MDMYLNAHRFIWTKVGIDIDIARDINALFPELPEDALPNEIEVQFGYWRNSNAIHDWFVKNVMHGEDDPRPHYVDRTQLRDLLDVVSTVYTDMNKAYELLSPRHVYFEAGGNGVDIKYRQDLEYTKRMLERALNSRMAAWDFYYHCPFVM